MVSKKDVDDLIKAGALIGGMWLAVEILKALSKKVYRCPVCQNEISTEAFVCPHCGTPVRWPK